jgi:hypothetical protein
MVIDSYEKSSTSQPLYCISLLTNNFDEDKRPEFTLTSESDRSIFPNTLRMRRLTMQITLAFPAVTNGCLFSLPFHACRSPPRQAQYASRPLGTSYSSLRVSTSGRNVSVRAQICDKFQVEVRRALISLQRAIYCPESLGCIFIAAGLEHCLALVLLRKHNLKFASLEENLETRNVIIQRLV